MFKRDKVELDDAEHRARMALCDIITALGKCPRERLPAVAAKLDEALAEANGGGAAAEKVKEAS